MAKGTKVRHVYAKAKRTYHRARGMAGMGGKLNPVIAGGVAQLGSGVLAGFIGPMGSPLAKGGVGWFMNNPTLLTMAGMELAGMVGGGLGLGAGTGTGGFV